MGNITKLKRAVAKASKEMTQTGDAYRTVLANYEPLERAYNDAKRAQDDAINKLPGGLKRYQEMAENRGEPMTAEELRYVQQNVLPAMDHARDTGDALAAFQGYQTAKAAYQSAKKRYKEACFMLNKYTSDKKTMKTMPAEDYKAWKKTMATVVKSL